MFDQNSLLRILQSGHATFQTLVNKMHISRKLNSEFSGFISKLIKEEKIFQAKNKTYYIPIFINEVSGQFRLNPKRFGFIDFNNKSIFISPINTGDAMDKDEVVVKVFKEPNIEDSLQGRIIKVLKRNRATFVGVVKLFGAHFGIIPNDAKINGFFRFINPENLKVDYEVKVKIIKFGKFPKIKVIKILGHKNDVAIDILVAMEDADILLDFKQSTLDESKKIPKNILNENIFDRKDLRKNLIVTIDGEDTKDFDDAIEVKKLSNGNYSLAVHIADVTHYVNEFSAIDDEAKERGTSIYLVDRVIPMLPKVLSNGICSLNPHVDRFVISVEIEIDSFGKTVNYKIYQSIINSSYRLTYSKVNKFYKEKKDFNDEKLKTMLMHAQDLSHIIRKFKKNDGYIDFEIEEAKIIINDEGKTDDIVIKQRGDAEIMIENFMVRANEVIALHATKKNVPFIYRVHDKPDIDRLTNLQNVMNILGIKVKVPFNSNPKSFSNAIRIIKEARFDDFIKIIMLRTMSKAIYSSNNIGHFGLASKAYTHFTSPIRRYPDLMVHRMIREYFFRENIAVKTEHFANILPAIAAHSSFAEQKAVDLERKINDIKKAEFFEQFIGHKYTGSIVSIMKFGFFVEFYNKVDGLVHVTNLFDGKYELKSNGYIFSNGKRFFTIGDKLEVVVIGVKKSEGKIDLVLAEQYSNYKSVQK